MKDAYLDGVVIGKSDSGEKSGTTDEAREGD
jgi:hypothetical protein